MPLVNKVFGAFDTDGDGMLTFHEVMHGLGQVLTGTTESRADFYFSLYDEDNSGQMEQDEILQLMENSKTAADVSQARVHEMLEKLGGDDNGVTLQVRQCFV
mgnify:CR=1 FL=1